MFSPRPFYSPRNGRIVLTRGWWRPEIEVDGYVQSGRYMKLLWRSALKQLEPQFVATEVLMLGLGAGSAIREVHARFAAPRVTALEWDETMIELAGSSRFYPKSMEPVIVFGDAITKLSELESKFELIMIDLFRGNIPEPRLANEETIAALASVLAPTGRIILNAFGDIRLIEALARQLDYMLSWKFRINHLAMYRAFDDNQKFAFAHRARIS